MQNFIGQFVLPLVQGGVVDVSRPFGPRTFAKLAAHLRVTEGEGAPEVSESTALVPARRPGARAANEARDRALLSLSRRRLGMGLLPGLAPPTFDEPSLRLTVAVHNLLALGHPALATAPARVRDHIIEYSAELAGLGPPLGPVAAVNRHTLLARLPELERHEHEVRNWLGTRTFVGREPPKRVLLWRRLRRVQVAHQQKRWLRDVGVPNDARRLWEALCVANPLLEALEPGRLDPPLSWDRLLEILRFAPLARAVGAHLIGQGLEASAEALVVALFRHGTLREGSRPGATVEAVAFGIQFLAHLYWLATVTRVPGDAGPALAALLCEASREPRLLFPADAFVASPMGDLRALFSARLAALRQRARLHETYVEDARATVAQALQAFSPGRRLERAEPSPDRL